MKAFWISQFILLLTLVLSDTIDSSSMIQPSNRLLQVTLDSLVTEEPAKHAEWRKAITQGITTLPKMGIPGNTIPFTMNAAVVVVGDTITDVLICAAQLGKGRVVVAAHTDYANNFKETHKDPSILQLQNNIKKWLRRGNPQSPLKLMMAEQYVAYSDSPEAVSDVHIVYCQEVPAKKWQKEKIDFLLKYVKNGGSLFVASTPWGWMQLTKSKNLQESLTYKTVLNAGILFTSLYIQNSQTFYVNKTAYLSHLAIQIDIALGPQNPAVNYTQTFKVLDQISSLKPEIIAGLQKKISRYLPINQVLKWAPSQEFPVTTAQQKTRLLCYQKFFLNQFFNNVAPNYDLFPGAVDKKAEDFKYVSRYFTLKGSQFAQFHHTGLYALAGQNVSVQIIGNVPNTTWQLSVGFHYDDDNHKQKWIRWPKVSTRRTLAKNNTFSSPFGGLIVIQSPSKSNQTIRIKVSSAVEAPWYDSQNQTSVKNWPIRKNAVGAWGCVQGKWVGFCMPRESFKDVDPANVLEIYDSIYVEYHNLRGTKPQSERKKYIIADIDPSVGYMHSGYPIVTHFDVADPENEVFLFNETTLKTKGSWGIFHELGHHMQRSWWTPSGAGQVTVNIFSLKATEMVLGKSPKQTNWFHSQYEVSMKYLEKPDYSKWKENADIGLSIYIQVIQDFGWDAMKNVLTSYETGDSSKNPTQNQDIIDVFWSKYSLEVKVNLQNLLKKWGIPYTSKFTEKVSALPPYVEKVKLYGP